MDQPLSSATVLAIGHSVRALVEACSMAGVHCIAVDHFGDADTRRFAHDRWIELKLTERGLLSPETEAELQSVATELLKQDKPAFFLLAGGMENLGAACEQLRKIAEVIGPSESQRTAMRDIGWLQRIAAECGLQVPAMRQSIDDGSGWLWKPLVGAGGLHISRKPDADVESDGVRSEGYWQQFIRGEPIGVSCLVSADGVKVLGATGGFDAEEWPGPLEFIYRGSYGLIVLSPEYESKIAMLCQRIHERTGYSGWLQFDFMREQIDGKEPAQLWLLECNPRWTAGMEVLVNAGNVNPVNELLSSLQIADTSNDFHDIHDIQDNCDTQSSTSAVSFAKAIVYAKQSIELSQESIDRLCSIEGIADLPHLPQRIEGGHPIVTVRAWLRSDSFTKSEAVNKQQLLDKLRWRAEQVWSAIEYGL